MSERVTATDAARRFSDLLNRVRYERQSFVIVRGGEEVGQLVPPSSGRTVTLQSLLEIVRSAGKPDAQFADDLEEIQAAQPVAGDSPWHS